MIVVVDDGAVDMVGVGSTSPMDPGQVKLDGTMEMCERCPRGGWVQTRVTRMEKAGQRTSMIQGGRPLQLDVHGNGQPLNGMHQHTWQLLTHCPQSCMVFSPRM